MPKNTYKSPSMSGENRLFVKWKAKKMLQSKEVHGNISCCIRNLFFCIATHLCDFLDDKACQARLSLPIVVPRSPDIPGEQKRCIRFHHQPVQRDLRNDISIETVRSPVTSDPGQA